MELRVSLLHKEIIVAQELVFKVNNKFPEPWFYLWVPKGESGMAWGTFEINRLVGIIQNEFPQMEYLVFEIEDSEERGITADERILRVRRKEFCTRLGAKMLASQLMPNLEDEQGDPVLAQLWVLQLKDVPFPSMHRVWQQYMMCRISYKLDQKTALHLRAIGFDE
jgi:hypothetical protein